MPKRRAEQEKKSESSAPEIIENEAKQKHREHSREKLVEIPGSCRN